MMIRGIGPSVEPTWWDLIRQVIIFALGVGVIIYAVASSGHDVAFLVTGLVLIGFVPVDLWVVTKSRSHAEDQ